MPRKNKRIEHLFGALAKGMRPYYHQLDLRSLDEVDDEAFAYIMTNVKGVNMLDLNETDIGNESMKLLTKLEYVKELRIKNCPKIDNDAIESLNNVKQLEFIHAKSTGITIDGLLKLKNHPNMMTIMFSHDGVEDIKDKMLKLRSAMPGCEFIIDGKEYQFEA